MSTIAPIQYEKPTVKNSGWFGKATDSDQALRGVYDTNATNVAIANAQNLAQYQMFQEANNYNTRMWNLENEYNTPQAQVQRMLQAGINPRVGIQGGDSGNSQSAPTSETPPQLHSPNIEAPTAAYQIAQDAKYKTLDAIGNVVGQANQTYSTMAQSRLAESQAALNEVDAVTRLAENRATIKKLLAEGRKTGLEGDVIQETKPTTIKTAEATLEGIQKDNRIKEIQAQVQENFGLNLAETQLDDMINSASLHLAQASNEFERYKIIKAETKRIEKQIELIEEQKKTEKSTQSANYASAEASSATAVNQRAQAEQTSENTKIIKRTAHFIVTKASAEASRQQREAENMSYIMQQNKWKAQHPWLSNLGPQIYDGAKTLFELNPMVKNIREMPTGGSIIGTLLK